ncbi:DUF998 domain-containing protein [Williamsia soli]|uniref:DUF998 domain-containing protein n=1 Tax=Williamsia soli TaxID=364929 RepID=UPI001A9DE713|nr:DUF998 domain-containing protein [Williamsia soli]
MTERPGVRTSALRSAAAAPVVLVATTIVAGILAPDSYDAVRQTISDLATIDSGGWLMTLGIGSSGALTVVTGLGLSGVRSVAQVTLVIAGTCGVLVALIPVDVNEGAHLIVAGGNLGLYAVWPLTALSRSSSAPRSLRPVPSVTAAGVLLVLFGWVLYETQGGDLLGISERICVTANLIWPLVVACSLRKDV